jgi:hypothetical protein
VSASISSSVSASQSISASQSASVSASPSEGYQDYTKGDYASLPAGTVDLETPYTEQEVLDVATSNDVRVAQSATGEYTIHQFKDWVGDSARCSITWEGQTNYPPVDYPVMLQIYDYNLEEWWTVASDTTSAVDTDFTLTANILDLSDYKSANLITCRVYQGGA